MFVASRSVQHTCYQGLMLLETCLGLGTWRTHEHTIWTYLSPSSHLQQVSITCLIRALLLAVMLSSDVDPGTSANTTLETLRNAECILFATLSTRISDSHIIRSRSSSLSFLANEDMVTCASCCLLPAQCPAQCPAVNIEHVSGIRTHCVSVLLRAPLLRALPSCLRFHVE